jgi:flagellar biosynthesis chaperone FliJ
MKKIFIILLIVQTITIPLVYGYTRNKKESGKTLTINGYSPKTPPNPSLPVVSNPINQQQTFDSKNVDAANEALKKANQDYADATKKLKELQDNPPILPTYEPAPTNQPNVITPTYNPPQVDCSTYSNQLASLIDRFNQIPTFAQYMQNSGQFQYGSTPGATESAYNNYISVYGNLLTNISNQITALKQQYPKCAF